MTDLNLIVSQIRQRLEILYQEIAKLEMGGGVSPDDAYTKAQTDNLLSLKADKATTYTKSQTDSLLDAKANAAAVYTKTETNAEIQGAITDLDVPSTTQSGHYIKSIAQVDGLIVPVADLIATTPIPASEKPITSGAVYTVNSILSGLEEKDRAALAEIIDNGAKNIANPLSAEGYSSQGTFPITMGGVTFTLNADGTITTSNTATTTTTMKIPVKLKTGKSYTISGCPSGGTSTSYRIDIRLKGTTTVKAYDYGEGAEFIAEQEDYDLCIRYQNGQEAAQTFSPMVCSSAAYAISPAFVPYVPSNAELYTMIQALQ